MSKFLRKNANPSLLNLLQIGCSIEFDNESGGKLIGSLTDGYIYCHNMFGFVGVYQLNEDGLKKALADKDIWES